MRGRERENVKCEHLMRGKEREKIRVGISLRG